MTDKLSAVPALKAGVDFDWWAMTFQSHLLLNKELKPLMVGKRLREPDDPKLAELQEEREALEAILFSALVKAADDHGTQNVLMWQLIRPFQDQVNEGTRAFAALRGYYCPTKMSGAFLLFEKFHDARIAVGEDLTAFGARLQRMRADVLGAAPKDARANFEKEMGPLSMTLAVMKALKDMADEKEWDSFRRQVFADMDRGDIVGNLGDFEKVTHSLFGVTNRIKVEAESALEGQKAVASGRLVLPALAGVLGRAEVDVRATTAALRATSRPPAPSPGSRVTGVVRVVIWLPTAMKCGWSRSGPLLRAPRRGRGVELRALSLSWSAMVRTPTWTRSCDMLLRAKGGCPVLRGLQLVARLWCTWTPVPLSIASRTSNCSEDC